MVNTKLNRDALARIIATRLSITAQDVTAVLNSLDSVCNGFVNKGYSFNLSEKIRLRLLGDSAVTLAPRNYMVRYISNDSKVPFHMTEQILDTLSEQVIQSVKDGIPLQVLGVMSVRVSRGGVGKLCKSSTIHQTAMKNGYKVRLLVSE